MRAKVESVIDNDRTRLGITELVDGRSLSQLEHTLKYGAAREARKQYLESDEMTEIRYRCQYSRDDRDDSFLFDYISDSTAYVAHEAEEYINDNQERILLQFMENDAVKNELSVLMADKTSRIYYIKNIMSAMKRTEAKTVNVTIEKNGVEFTFKTECFVLRNDCSSYYST